MASAEMYSIGDIPQLLDGLGSVHLFRGLALLTIVWLCTILSSAFEPTKWLFYGPKMVKERYKKFGKHFTISTPEAKVHFFSSADHIRQLSRQPNEKLDNMHAAFMTFQPANTMPGLNFSNFGEHTLEYHRVLKRFQGQERLLTETMQSIIREVLRKHVGTGTEDDGWTMISTFNLCVDIISRLSACVFLGVNPKDSELSAEIGSAALPFAFECVIGAEASRILPKFIRKWMIWICSGGNKRYWRLRLGIRQIVAQRVEKGSPKADMNEGTTRKDYLECILETFPERDEATVDKITNHFIMLWIASIMQPVVTMTYVFHDLAAHQQYIPELRHEIEQNKDQVESTGSLSSLKFLDSFIKESTRMNSLESFVLRRHVISAFKFTDGTVVPKGEYMGAPMKDIMNDPCNYPEPSTFNPYRFVRGTSKARTNSVDDWPPAGNDNSNDLAETSPTYLFWAYGRHTCPGRYYASHELKLITMEVLSQLQIKADTNPPQTVTWRSTTFPLATNNIGLQLKEGQVRPQCDR